MDGYTVKPIDDMETVNDGIVKLAGAELGVESFGLQVFDFPPEFPDYPEHDHAREGMEEIYIVLRGSAEFEIDGERVPLDRERMIRVAAEQQAEAPARPRRGADPGDRLFAGQALRAARRPEPAGELRRSGSRRSVHSDRFAR